MSYSNFSFLLSIFFLEFTPYINAQNPETKTYKVSLVQKNDTIAVPYAIIKNLNTKEIFQSDDHGVIFIKGLVGNSINFHCLGFEDQSFRISGVWENMSDGISLGIESKIYSLDQVDIVRDYTYAQFVHAFRNMPWIETE